MHYVIFDAFDRFADHLYDFRFGEKPCDRSAPRYTSPMAMEDIFDLQTDSPTDASKATIDSLGLKVGHVFSYLFDLGDCWWHQINVIAIDDKAPKGRYPGIIKVIGESPPQYIYPEEGFEEEEKEHDDYPVPEKKSTVSGKIERLPIIADPTVEQVLKRFLKEQGKRLKPVTMRKYEDVVELLQVHLNGYGYEGLSKAETALFN